ncbi:ankyrin repeat protein [Reticulomyxa filosa]|uniref:Ankyrin repeat protein n=1 Tax=Reticulomyxa filosa TaxID=46433 RepID=X6NKJ8_RETFI|nr:ankyrin repeat protein [Reticulomyxa filosa]|eukprot:ETO26840.1 ankyrin repeat protein [Reticulomyxa filosa]
MATEEEQKSKTIDDLVDAIRQNKPDLVQEILLTSSIDVNTFVKGADVHLKNILPKSALLKAKADPNIAAFPSGDTPLHIASMWAEPKLVEILLEHKANAMATNNDNKNPVNVVGSKLKSDDKSNTTLDKKSEVQLLLKKKKELDNKIEDAETGLQNLKIESNQRINAVQRAQGQVYFIFVYITGTCAHCILYFHCLDCVQKFDQMWPYMCCPANRYKVWCVKNIGVNEFLAKRYVKVSIPTYVDKDEIQHFNFSKIQDFQKTMAKELLLKGGLNLEVAFFYCLNSMHLYSISLSSVYLKHEIHHFLCFCFFCVFSRNHALPSLRNEITLSLVNSNQNDNIKYYNN